MSCSTQGGAGSEPQRVELGRVIGAHGLRGEIRVRHFAEEPENLLQAGVLWLAARRDDPAARRFAVERSARGRPGEVRLLLEGVGDREAARALRGCVVLAEPGSLEALPEDEFYWHELVGCRVETADGEWVGRVLEIWQTGGHDVLVVEPEPGRRVLVPTVREIMLEVEREARRIVIDAIPGLLDG